VKGSFWAPSEAGLIRPLGLSTCGSKPKRNLEDVLGETVANLQFFQCKIIFNPLNIATLGEK
jgi:hypothetical protein